MQIKVNDRTVEIFSGARVADALRAYSLVTWKQVQQGSKTVCDRHGHEIALDGELAEGTQIRVKRARRREARS